MLVTPGIIFTQAANSLSTSPVARLVALSIELVVMKTTDRLELMVLNIEPSIINLFIIYSNYLGFNRYRFRSARGAGLIDNLGTCKGVICFEAPAH